MFSLGWKSSEHFVGSTLDNTEMVMDISLSSASTCGGDKGFLFAGDPRNTKAFAYSVKLLVGVGWLAYLTGLTEPGEHLAGLARRGHGFG